MRKLFLFIALAMTCNFLTVAKAQDYYKKTTFKLYVGMNGSALFNPNLVYTTGEKSNIKLGFNSGFRVDRQFNRFVAFQTGLDYSMKGNKSSSLIFDSSYRKIVDKYIISSHYLSIPVLAGFRYDFNTKTDVQLQINTGPYIAVGVAGKAYTNNIETVDYEHSNITDKQKLFGYVCQPDAHTNGSLHMWRFDMGWKFELGFNINSVYLGVAYDLGCIDIQNRAKRRDIIKYCDDNSIIYDKDYKARNKSLSFNVGYIF